MQAEEAGLLRKRLEILIATTVADLDWAIGERAWRIVLFGRHRGLIDKNHEFEHYECESLCPLDDPEADKEFLEANYLFEDISIVSGFYNEINLSVGRRAGRYADGFAFIEKSRAAKWLGLDPSDPEFEQRAYQLLADEIAYINAYYNGEYYDVMAREVLVCRACNAEHCRVVEGVEILHLRKLSDLAAEIFQTEIGYTLRAWGVFDLQQAIQDGVVRLFLYSPYFESRIEEIKSL